MLWPCRIITFVLGDDLALLTDLWVASWQATMPGIDFSPRRDWFCIYLQDIERQGGMTLCAFDAEDTLAGFMLLRSSRETFSNSFALRRPISAAVSAAFCSIMRKPSAARA